MSTTGNAPRISADLRERLEDLLSLLNWAEIPEVDPTEPEYPNLAIIFVEGTESMIRNRGRDWIRAHPEDVRADWGQLLAVY